MSRRVCHYAKVKLPDDTTCGSLCETFPSCLPPISPETLSQIRHRIVVGGLEAEATADTAEALEQLREAIDRGLARKDESSPQSGESA